MKLTKKTILIMILLLNFVIITGCWNYREVNDLAICTGLAIDKNENNQYVVTVEILNPQSKGAESELTPVILSMEGDSIFDAIRNIIVRSGKKLYWSHAKIGIISEEIARKGIISILEFIERDAEFRADMKIMVSKEKTAGEILKSHAALENTVSFQLNNVIKSFKFEPEYLDIELWKFIQLLSGEGISAYMPTANLIEYNGTKIPQIYGTALFKRDKLVGFLDGTESLSLTLLTEENVNGLLVKIEKEEEHAKIIYEISNNSTKYKPLIIDGELTMKIDVELVVGLAELSNIAIEFSDEEVHAEMEKELEANIRTQINHLLDILQKKYQVDSLGFGSIILREMPKEWKKIDSYWKEIYPDLQTIVNVEANIESSALISEVITVGD